MPRVRTSALLVLLAAAPAVAQQVHTAGPGGEFAALQAAIDFAQPGDVVRVLGGVHENVVIDKGLLLVGYTGMIGKAAEGPGADAPALLVKGVPADQTVVIAGPMVFVFGGGASAAVHVEDCAGAVWVLDTFVDSYGAAALVAQGAGSLVLGEVALQCNLVPALPDGTPQAAPGAWLRGGTRAFVHGGFSLGSHGALALAGLPQPTAAPDGGAGLLVEDAQAHVHGAELLGGSGNSLFAQGCTSGGDGGAGLVTLDGPAPGAPWVTLRQATVQGGGVGFHTQGCAPAPVPGAPFDVLPGSVALLAATPRRLDLPSLALQGQSLTLELSGAPGDLALLCGSTSAAPAAALGGLDLHLRPDGLFLVAAFALPTGELALPASAPLLPAGLEAVVVPLQAFFVDAQGGRHASGPRVLVVD